MPKYIYFCTKCEETFEVRHLLAKIHTICELCNVEGCLERKPTGFFLTRKDSQLTSKSGPGRLVKATIEETKEELKMEHERLKNREYNSP